MDKTKHGNAFVHGESSRGPFGLSAEYRVWAGMIQRCTNPKAASYSRYGAIGVSVCKRWRESFRAFLEDVGRRPTGMHSLDRYPNCTGNYEPGNVRWATTEEQSRNKRNTVKVTVNGHTIPLAEAAEQLGVSRKLAWTRMQRGWTVEEALQLHTRSYKAGVSKRNVFLTLHGKTMTAAEWARERGFHVGLIEKRLNRGWTVQETLLRPARRSDR